MLDTVAPPKPSSKPRVDLITSLREKSKARYKAGYSKSGKLFYPKI